MELTEVAMMARIAENPEEFALAGESKAKYLEYHRREVKKGLKRARAFREWVRAGKAPVDFRGDSYGVGETICYELCDRFGPGVLENVMRLFRHDAISPDVYEATDSDLRRQTFLWCLFSCAAGEDLRPYFRDWGFEVDNAYFDRLMPVIKRAVRDLPEPDVEGWSYCPGNKRFYRLTPWPMTFWEAEAAARTYGGHLAAVRNAAEAEWLAGRFAGRGALWIGITDDGTEGRWRRLDGSINPFAYWNKGEPNGGTRENAVIIHFRGQGARWVDVNKEDRNLAVIEIPAPTRRTRSSRR